MVTPLAPVIESMTPWAKTLVAEKATRRMTEEYCILNIFEPSENGEKEIEKIVNTLDEVATGAVRLRDRKRRR